MTAVAPPPAHEPSRQIDSGQYFAAYPLAAIRESPLNPREHYDTTALQELAANLAAQGQLMPGLARVIESEAEVEVGRNLWPVVELAAGHRRRRALLLAGLPTMALVSRIMTDAEFAEALVTENPQHNDLHPLEQARGYRMLMEQAGYDIARVASRMGKDRSTIYDRVKLLQLVPDAQALFMAGRFELGHAVLLARLSPSDQKRAITTVRSNDGKTGGLFIPEAFGLFGEGKDEAAGKDPLARTQGMKPVSVREFQKWIDRNIRFRPESEDLPNLFPATAEALTEAAEAELKVVKITREYRVPDEARDEKERTYGEQSWRRADGVAEPSRYGRKPAAGKTCEHAVMGVIVAGPGRGDAFKVCIAKKKCTVHWAKEIREAAKAALLPKQPKSRGSSTYSSKAQSNPGADLRAAWEKEEVAAAAERLRPKVIATIKDIALPDEIAWNLANVVDSSDGFGGWAAVGKEASWYYGGLQFDLTQQIRPHLPGKWNRDNRSLPADADAARSAIALAVCLARDFGDREERALGERVQARWKAHLAGLEKETAKKPKAAAKSKAADSSKARKKSKGAKRTKPTKKLAGDVRRAKAVKR
jgi:ParB/RepB/Spo0J family partition protein